MYKPVVFTVLALFLIACDTEVTSATSTAETNSIGTIREIDKEDRRMVLSIDNKVLTLRANEQVVNFDQLQAGDRVRFQYRSATAVRMALPEEEVPLSTAGVEVTAPEGGLPGAAGVEETVVTAEFLEYDSRTKQAWLLLEGDIYTLVDVPRDLRGFARARERGDRIFIVLDQAVLISVEPA